MQRRPTGLEPIPLAAAALAPLALYGVLYALHYRRCLRFFWTLPNGGVSKPEPFLVRVIASLVLWAAKSLNPWYAVIRPEEVPPYRRFLIVDNVPFHAMAPELLALGLLLVGLMVLLRKGFTRKNLALNGPLLALLAAILLSYSAINNCGRTYIQHVSYYAYFFSLLGMVLVYSLVDFSRLARAERAIALMLLGVLSLANAAQTYRSSKVVAAVNDPIDAYCDRVDAFVRMHREEAGFKFIVRGPRQIRNRISPGMYVYLGYPDHKPDGVASVTQLLYMRYYDPGLADSNPLPPKYVFHWEPPGPPSLTSSR